jgi:putative FmdB family regulatory protein
VSFKVYDYRCLACGNVQERRVRASEADAQECDECTGKMKRLMSAPPLGIHSMANAGCPGAYETVGNQYEKRHRREDQAHRKAQR